MYNLGAAPRSDGVVHYATADRCAVYMSKVAMHSSVRWRQPNN